MDNFIPALRDSIFDATYELTTDYLEVGLDSLLESGVLKELPIVKTITGLYKLGQNMYQRNQLKQTLSFIQGFNMKELNQAKVDQYKEKVFNDPQKCEEELGRVMIILDHHIDNIQSKVLGCFFHAYVCGAVSWEKFCELSEANRRMFVADYELLRQVSENSNAEVSEKKQYQCDRLTSLGLLKNESIVSGSVLYGGSSSPVIPVGPSLTSFGKTFYQLMRVVNH